MKPNYAVLLLSFLLSSLLHAQNIPSYLPSSGLVAWYPFSGNAIDSSGNGNNGTLNGSVSLTNDRFGNANSCYSFPGTSNSYIDCGNSSSLQIIEAISISGWFYMDGGNYNPRIISFEGSGGFGVFMDGTLNTSRIIHATNYNADGTGTGFCCSSSQGFSVAALQWHHFIYTADSTGLAKMYIDGDLVGTYQGTPVTNISFAGAVLNIGRLSKPVYDAWGGKLDDIGIWNRALSSSEIQTIYSACTLTYSVPQDTLIACGVDSAQIDAGSGFSTYAWSNGSNTQSTYVSTSGMYHITVTNSNGCEAEDSVYVSLINAQIEQNDTTICAFESINLGLATFDNSTSPDLMQSDLQNGLLAWYPFNGNSNDESGNGNHGTATGALLTTNRTGDPATAYNFDGNDRIDFPGTILSTTDTEVSISLWFKLDTLIPVVYTVLRYRFNGHNYAITKFSSNTIQMLIWDGSSWTIIYEEMANTNWNHCVITNSSSANESNVYLNGILVGTEAYVNNGDIENVGFTAGVYPTGTSYTYGIIDDIAIYNRALSLNEARLLSGYNAYSWSTGDTTTTINVTPTQTTTYYVTMTDGVGNCADSITITIDNPQINLSQDTVLSCGVDSILLDAGSGFSTYAWSNGENTQSTYVSASGMYHITVTNSNGCEAEDSVYVSLINAQIEQNDTTLCTTDSIQLRVVNNLQPSACNEITANLQNELLANYPFCGNANDASGSGNHGTIDGATLTFDRFGNANSAYSFDGNDEISLPSGILTNTASEITISLWAKLVTLSQSQHLFRYRNNGHNYRFAILGNGELSVDIFNGSNWSSLYQEPIDTGSWRHIVITNSQNSNESRVYVDGQLASSNNYIPNLDLNNDGVRIGAYPGNINPFIGEIDDVLIFGRAITSQEVLQLFGVPSYSWSTGDTTATINVTPTQTTTYYVTMTDGVGSCTDSVIVTINNSSNGTDIQIACDTYTWIDGVTYTASTSIPTFMLMNVDGCDSLVTLNLTLDNSLLTQIDTLAVGSFTWPLNGNTYSTTGVYKDTITSISGCDSIIELALTIVAPPVISTQATDTVVCEGAILNIGVSVDSSSNAFTMMVRTNNAGASNSNQFQLTGAEGNYNIVATHIASGNIETFDNLSGQQTLTFSNGAGDYLVKVFAKGSSPFHRIQFNNTGDKSKLLEISNWGTIAWSSFAFAFYGCSNLTLNAADAPNLNSVTDMSSMFRNAAQFDQYIGDWDVSSITSLHFTFAGASLFNQALGTWDVSSVTNFGKTFGNATSFNQDLSNWDVSSATNMGYMFDGATSFNQGIGTWDVSNVTYMSFMFQNATIFNQNLSGWCVTNFVSLPSGFSTSSGLGITNQPVWGTCP